MGTLSNWSCPSSIEDADVQLHEAISGSFWGKIASDDKREAHKCW